MGYRTRQPSWRTVLAIADGQHGVVTRAQLIEHGLPAQAIKHRVGRRRLHPVARGVYAVGRPQLGREGRWMAALLACGPGAVLSHSSAGALLGIVEEGPLIEVSVSPPRTVTRPGVSVHRRTRLAGGEVWVRNAIPVTGALRTLVDLAPRLGREDLEDVIDRADRLGLADPERLRAGLDRLGPGPGVGRLRATLDRHTLVLTDSQLERRLLPISRRAGLGRPLTQQRVNGYRVDFYWPDLGLVVETDGLRYHRTAVQQSRDARRDQAHSAAGLTPLRFSHSQVAYQSQAVEATLRRVGRLLDERVDPSR